MIEQGDGEGGFDLSGLLPCPFCGTKENLAVQENGKHWLGMKYSDAVSIDIRHWCPPIKGQPHPRVINRVGRDFASAAASWNTRAIVSC